MTDTFKERLHLSNDSIQTSDTSASSSPRFSPNPQSKKFRSEITEEQKQEIKEAFDLFDERVVVDDIQDVSSILETDDNTVVLRIIYHIKDLPIEYYSYDYSYTRAID